MREETQSEKMKVIAQKITSSTVNRETKSDNVKEIATENKLVEEADETLRELLRPG